MPNRKSSRSAEGEQVTFKIETEREPDGRWIAEVINMPGVLAYGATKDAANANAYALALRVIADGVETGKNPPKTI